MLTKLEYTSKSMEKIDRLEWVAGMNFTTYGTRVGIRVSDSRVLEQLSTYLPPGCIPSSEPIVQVLYSLRVGGNEESRNIRRYHLVYSGASRLAQTLELDEAMNRLEGHLQLVVAANSTEYLFVHAGVVGWQGQAIVIPGRSFSGKTSLVAALLKAGAVYYSDEFAVFDRQGQVWPYARRLSLRDQDGRPQRRCQPEELGGRVGQTPLPVGLVVMTRYQPDSRWQARSLSPGQTVLALLDNTVAARSQPEFALTILRQVATQAKAIKSKRGEAEMAVKQILSHIPV